MARDCPRRAEVLMESGLRADRALLTGTAYASTASITLLLKNTVTSVRPGVYDYYKDVDTRSRINPTTPPP